VKLDDVTDNVACGFVERDVMTPCRSFSATCPGGKHLLIVGNGVIGEPKEISEDTQNVYV
jgi:hypothetical protein